MSVGEVDSGVFGIAAPTFGENRRVIGSIGMVRTTGTLGTRRLGKASRALIDIATQLSRPAGKDE